VLEVQAEHQRGRIRHAEEETMADEFNECLEAASYIIKQRGVTDQNSMRAYVKGDVRFERTNTNDIEVTVSGKAVLFAPPPGSSNQVIWEPDDWVQVVYEIKERIEQDEQERISRAKEYCEGYNYGVYEGRRKYSAPETDGGGSPSHQAGFARGVAAAQRAKIGESAGEQTKMEDVRYRAEQFESVYRQRPLLEEESKCWSDLQATMTAHGQKSWEDILLRLHFDLGLYGEGAKSATYEERLAVGVVQTAVIKSLARTSLVLPVPG